MGRNLIEIYDAPASRREEEAPPFAYLPDRAATHERLRSVRGVDLIVIGCGHFGATCAHLAAVNDLRVLLVHPARAAAYVPSTAGAFAAALLGKSNAPAIPTLVAAGTDTRQLIRRAPHLVQTVPLTFVGFRPLYKRLHLAFALTMWGVASRTPSRGLFPHVLTSVDDRSLIAESVLAAQQEGALYLNAISPSYLESERESQCYILGIDDPVMGARIEVRCGAIAIDPDVGWLPGSRLAPVGVVRQERGVRDLHVELCPNSKIALPAISKAAILANQRWPALVQYSSEHISFTFPDVPDGLEREVVTSHVTEALQAAGLATAPIVSMRVTHRGAEDRRVVKQRGGVFEPSMRGPWDALSCSHEVLKRIFAAAGGQRTLTPLRGRPLPGDTRDGRAIVDFLKESAANGIGTAAAEMCASRWHGRVRSLREFPDGYREVAAGVVRGEISLALAADRAYSLSDVAIGSLEIYTMRDWREFLIPLAKIVGELQGREISDDEIAACAWAIDSSL